jgi:hypothetical protein
VVLLGVVLLGAVAQVAAVEMVADVMEMGLPADLATAADHPAVVLLVVALQDRAVSIASGVMRMRVMALQADLILAAPSRVVSAVIVVIALVLIKAVQLVGRGLVNSEEPGHQIALKMNGLGNDPLGEEDRVLQINSHLHPGWSNQHQLVLQRLRHLVQPLLMICFGDAMPLKLHLKLGGPYIASGVHPTYEARQSFCACFARPNHPECLLKRSPGHVLVSSQVVLYIRGLFCRLLPLRPLTFKV